LKAKRSPGSNPLPSRDGEPAAGSPSAAATGRPRRPARNPRRRPPAARRLIETPGPEPSASLDDVRLTVGTIAGTHGVYGELKMRVLTDDPEHLTTLTRVYLGDNPEAIALKRVRFNNGTALITLAGVTTPEAGAQLYGLPVRIAGTDARPLAEGEFFLFQLVGLRAEAEDGTPIGTVVDLIETGAYDVLVIGERPDTSEQLLVPNHPDFIPVIEPEQGRIVVRPPVYENELPRLPRTN